LTRSDRQRGAEEQRRDQPLARIRDHGVGQKFAEREAQGERHDDAEHRRRDRGAAAFLDDLEVGLHAGHQQDQQHGELRDRFEHRFLLFGGRKQSVLHVREQRPEERGAEHQAGHELSHDGGLTQPQQHFAQQPADHPFSTTS